MPLPLFKRLCLFVVALAILIPSPPVSSASGGQIGTVDLSMLVIFHPNMAWYDPSQKRFRKQAPQKTTTEMARKGEEVSEQTQQVASQKRLLEGKLEETRRRFDRQTRALQEEFDRKVVELATGTAAVERNMFQIRNNQLHQKFTAEIKALAAQVQVLEQRFIVVAETDLTGQMTSPAETEQMFRNILLEIRNTVARVAASKGISVVLDRGPSDLVGTLNIPNNENLIDNSYARLLSLSAPNSHTEQHAATVPGHFSVQTNLVQDWLRTRMAVLRPYQSALFSQRVLLGGIDLTYDCVNTLLVQKKISGTTLQTILACVRAER